MLIEFNKWPGDLLKLSVTDSSGWLGGRSGELRADRKMTGNSWETYLKFKMSFGQQYEASTYITKGKSARMLKATTGPMLGKHSEF